MSESQSNIPTSDHEPDQMPDQLLFTVRKSTHFRVIHVDGAQGAISPTGRYIHMALYNERRAMPREQLYGFNPDGTLQGEPKATEGLDGIFREVEVCAVLDIPVARALHAWLGKHLEMHAQIAGAIETKHAEKSSH